MLLLHRGVCTVLYGTLLSIIRSYSSCFHENSRKYSFPVRAFRFFSFRRHNIELNQINRTQCLCDIFLVSARDDDDGVRGSCHTLLRLVDVTQSVYCSDRVDLTARDVFSVVSRQTFLKKPIIIL